MTIKAGLAERERLYSKFTTYGWHCQYDGENLTCSRREVQVGYQLETTIKLTLAFNQQGGGTLYRVHSDCSGNPHVAMTWLDQAMEILK